MKIEIFHCCQQFILRHTGVLVYCQVHKYRSIMAQAPIKDAWWSEEKEKDYLRLTEDLKSTANTLEIMLQRNKIKESEISALKVKNEQLQRDYEEMANRVDTITDEKDSIHQQLNTSLLELKSERSLKDQIQRDKQIIIDTNRRQLETKDEESKNKELEIQRLKDQIQSEKQSIDTYSLQLQRKDEEIQRLKDQIQSEKQIIDTHSLQLQGKDEEAQRLSKETDSKPTDNNLNITSLVDPNRPMKIAEYFSELYDNEWTDAMDLCQKVLGSKVNEDNILENLYTTLMSCYKICEEKSEIWIQNARGRFEDFTKVLMIEAQDEVLKQIIASRKLTAEETSKRLLMDVRSPKDEIAKKHLKSIDAKYHKMLIPSQFFAQCFTLCWKMVVQTPQMILREGPRAGEEFDKNVFREYTSSGSRVVFTVWPALFLHKDGPLLAKGVVKVK